MITDVRIRLEDGSMTTDLVVDDRPDRSARPSVSPMMLIGVLARLGEHARITHISIEDDKGES